MQSSVIAQCCSISSENGVPKKIQILPAGPGIPTIDGRFFVLSDAQALVDKMNSYQREFVIDYNHADNFARANGGEAPAAGWMKNFSVGDDGSIYAEVEWTDKARNEIERKEYKYISPTLFHNSETKEITGFSGAALVNFPALTMQALCSVPVDQQPDTYQTSLAGEVVMLRAELNSMNHMRLEQRRQAAFEAVRRNHLPMLLLGVMEERCSASGIDEMNSFADALGKTSCRIEALSEMQTVRLGIHTINKDGKLTDAETAVCNALGISPENFINHKNNEA